MSSLDLSQFPFTHTRVFSRIVESLDSSSLLTCRRVCITWQRWIKKSKVWTQLAPIRISLARENADGDTLLNYRLDRIMLMPRETEAEFRALAVKVDRLAGETEPAVFQSGYTELLLKRMLEAWEQGALDNPVLGPVAAHVRVKVEHKVIKKIVKETLAKYLNCIVVDNKDNGKKIIFDCKVQSLTRGQNWTTADFSGKQKRIPLSTEMERGMRGELTLEEALKESLKSEDEDKKREREEEVDAKEAIEPKSKKSKLDDEGDLTENSEDPNEEIEPILKSHPKFPTLLELLDFDTPIIKEVLIHRCQIDNELIVPQVFDCLNFPDLFETSFLAKGVDSDGEVKGIPMDTFRERDGACINDVQPANEMNRFSTEQVLFWGGPDIRHNWPEFSQQLDAIDERERQNLLKKERLAKQDLKKKEEILVKTIKSVSRKTGATGWAPQGLNTVSIEVRPPTPGPSQENVEVQDLNSCSATEKPDASLKDESMEDAEATNRPNTSKRFRKLGTVSTNQAGNSSEGASSIIQGASTSKSVPTNQAGSSSEDGKKIAGAINIIGSDSFAHLLARGINLSVATKK